MVSLQQAGKRRTQHTGHSQHVRDSNELGTRFHDHPQDKVDRIRLSMRVEREGLCKSDCSAFLSAPSARGAKALAAPFVENIIQDTEADGRADEAEEYRRLAETLLRETGS